MFEPPCISEIDRVVAQALAEDVGSGDVTSQATILPETAGRAVFLAKDTGVLAGLPVLRRVFARVDERVQVRDEVQDGAVLTPGVRIAVVEGPARSLLTGERVALN